MNHLTEVCETIKQAKSIALICHVNPDGDTLGSALALRLCLEKLGKHVDVFCSKSVPKVYRFLAEAENVLSVQNAGQYDTAILVDLSEAKRAGDCGDIYEKAENKAVIDHHIVREELTVPAYVRSDYGACAMAVMDVIDELGIEIAKEEAELLYVGLTTDTGRFGYSNADRRAMEYGARLVGVLGDVSKLCEELYGRATLRHTLLIKKTLENMRFALDGRIVYSILTWSDFVQCDATAEDAEGLIDNLRRIEGVCASFIIRENPDGGLNVSMRTTEGIKANEVMALLGGGGHERAAGASVTGRPEEIAKIICDGCEAQRQ